MTASLFKSTKVCTKLDQMVMRDEGNRLMSNHSQQGINFTFFMKKTAKLSRVALSKVLIWTGKTSV